MRSTRLRATLGLALVLVLALLGLPGTASAAVPAPPVLSADTNSNKTVDLVWTPIAGATSYRICEELYNPDNGTGDCLGTVTDTTSRRGPLASGDYRYFVTAINADGESAASNKVDVHVPQPEGVPTVTVSEPDNGDTVSGTVTLSATTDEPDEDVMEYLIDGQLVADDAAGDNTDGFDEPWDSSTVPDGPHYFQARATDLDGESLTTAPDRIYVDNDAATPTEPAPSVTVTAPSGGATVSGQVALQASAPDADVVAYYVDGTTFINDDDTRDNFDGWGETWDSTTVADGSHTITAKATNANGTTTSAGVTVTVDNVPDTPTDPADPQPPAVTLTAPADGAEVSGSSVTLDATSADATLMEYLVDGVMVADDGSNNTDGWSEVWDSTTVEDGTYEVVARASNANGTTTSSPHTITVANGQECGADCNPQSPDVPASGTVRANDETEAFSSGTGDIADDPAVWVDTTDPTRSVVIGSKKAASGGGLAVYDLDGNELSFLSAGEVNNVDVRTGVLGDRVLVTASNRTDSSLSYFFLDPATRTLSAAGSTSVGFEPYGACLYVSPADGDVFAFVTNRNSGFDFDQYQLTASGSTVSGAKVRDLSTSSLSEGCVADDEGGGVFLSQEDDGVYRYGAEPGDGSTRSLVTATGSNGMAADVEGLAIARDRYNGPDYLLVSSQGNSSYGVFDLASPFTHRRTFTVSASADGSVDAVTGTDGLDVTRADLGPAYPEGLVVVHDTSNSGASVSNFKLVDAGQVFGAYGGGSTPTDPPPTDRGPSGTTVIWNDDFESGLDCSIWERVQNEVTSNSGTNTDCTTWAPDGDGSRLSFPQDGGDEGTGDRYARFELRNGDVSAPGAGTGHRSEISGDSAPWQFHDGDERWIQMRIYKETAGMADTILTQFHAGQNSPPLELGLDGTDLTIDSHADGTVPTTVLATAAEWPAGTWIDVNLHIKWSQSASTGGVEAFVNGVRATPWLSGRTMNTTSSRIYMKTGMYRGSDTAGTYVARFDDLVLSRN